MSTLSFFGQFTASKVGKTGLTVTVDIARVTRSDGTQAAAVTAGSAVEVTSPNARGLYVYTLTGADLTLYDYVATFITSDATVDQKHVAGMWTRFSEGDAAAIAAVPTANANADALLGRNEAGGSSTGRLVKEAVAALRNKIAFDVPGAGQFTVFAADDTTPLWTGTYTATPGANPVTVLDPA